MPVRSSSAAPTRIPSAPRPAGFAPSDRPRLSPAYERFTYAVVAALVVSGIAWLVCHYALSGNGAPHPAEPLWLEIHGAAGMFGLVLFGMLFATHMQRAWALGRGRASGGTLAVAFAVLAVSGYGLYYVGDDDARAWIGAAHWVIGLAFPTVFAIHVARLRTQLRRVPSD